MPTSRGRPAAKVFRSGDRMQWPIPWHPEWDAPTLPSTAKLRTVSLTNPANVRQEESRSQAVKPVAVMIQNAAASAAAELILWLWLRLGQEPEPSVGLFRKYLKRRR